MTLDMLNLTVDKILVLGILIFNIIFSMSSVLRTDVVAVSVLVLLGITHLLPPDQLFSGFSSEAVIALIGVMVIGAGLEKSGIAVRIARIILKAGRGRPQNIETLLMLIAGLLASFMRNVGSVALLLPVVSRISLRTAIPKSRFLLPIAYCAILGGTLTIVGSSPLIVLNTLVKNLNEHIILQSGSIALPHFHLLEVFPVGVALLLCGICYLSLGAKKILAKIETELVVPGSAKEHFFKTYGKTGDILEVKVLPNSPLVGKTLRELENILDSSMAVLAIADGKEMHFPPLRKIIIKANAWIAILSTQAKIIEFANTNSLAVMPSLNIFSEMLSSARAGLCEAVIPPSSHLIGEGIGELHMRRKYELHVLALYRGNKVYQGEELKSLNLRSGDTLGMYSRWDALANFHQNPDFVVVTSAYPKEENRIRKMPFALFFGFLPLVMVLMGNIPLSVSLLLGATGMIASGVLNVDEAYASVSWQNVFLIAGFMPLGIAMQSTGVIELLTQYISPTGISPLIAQIFLAMCVTFFALFISNIGATVIFVPVAFDLALKLGVDPRLFILTVALAASNTFMVRSNQVNALIAGPGNYKASDFIRIGSVMTVLYWIVIIIMLNLVFHTKYQAWLNAVFRP